MNKAKVKKIFKIVFEALACALIVCLFIAFMITRSSGKTVFIGGKTTMWVMTESMSPTISPKTCILVEKIDAEDVEVGDIVVFVSTDPRIKGQYNTHRVIEKNGNVFITKGDNNPTDDGIYSAKAENIVARYVTTLKVVTFFGRVIISPVGFAIVMAVFFLTTVLCILPSVRDAFKEKHKEDEEAKQAEMERRIKEEVARLEREGASAEELRKEINDPPESES